MVWQLGARGRDAAQEVKALFREIVPEAKASGQRKKITQVKLAS